ncbi:MAG: hypothetical protein KGJ90_00455 [Patescibacteria group bacterium]|nr:hypothetical protein [Patescibacteria group bacterium]
MSDTTIMETYAPIVQTTALWLWDTSGYIPVVSGYPSGIGASGFTYTNTKTGLQPVDLQKFVGVPLQYYGNPSVPVDNDVITGWIRYAEDMVEQETSILLCQTWVASPPAFNSYTTNVLGLSVNTSTGFQVRGHDYDLEDNAYDFIFSRAQDEGWMYQILRYRPVQSLTYNVSGNPATVGQTAVKNTAFVYPLLNEFFRIPPSWNVEDKDFGLIRYVPAVNVQMLPLFAMQLAFMGFAEDVPGAIWLQYTAGLCPADYSSRFSFMKQLVLAEASIIALNSIQGTVNLGAEEVQTTVDGLSFKQKFNKGGPFGPLIDQFTKRRDALLEMARSKVEGPVLNSF